MKNEEDLKTNNNSEDQINRKRKSTTTNNSSSSSTTDQDYHHHQFPKRVLHQNLDHEANEDNDFLALRLRTISEQELSSLSSSPPLSEPMLIHHCQQQQRSSMQKFIVPHQPQHQQQVQNPLEYLPAANFMHEPLPVYRAPEFGSGGGGVSSVSRPLRARRNPTQTPGQGKSETVPALFPWATTSRATVHPLNYLLARHITSIRGEVQCKKCDRQYEMEFDLKDKFLEVGRFIAENKSRMHDRAPSVWMNPALPSCRFCEQENSAKPVIPEKKKQINWLFLLLGQLLGCCTLEQLKYFCKHTKNHRTGAKDRVLYLTYLGLCKQLDPTGPFDR
ncbi:hypothetical protein Ddye_003857 [Dipteronia dyeriana]|uniref:DUF7086 domain-containing protein n=1 Tax=Dipteronia dyeriana TaxID=168575 RepID=A0AAD9XTT1_9ROSI|nr:hypothetical protein Ddye_003857 [Dipteronia dyeriana]